ncbi:MAG TPA: hypothetical protein VES42_03120 [Pilimelia sp.]|nr:hypothetical protein [Pilimelia sp.]
MEAITQRDTLAEFFDRYGAALTAGDLTTIAGCYALPGMVVADGYSFSFSSPAAVALSFLGAAPAYQERELVAAHADITDVQRLSDGLVLAAVRWEYLDCRGAAVPGERYRYVVRLGRTAPQICVVLPGAADLDP